MLVTMNLDDYEPAYVGYAFSQPATIAGGAINTTKPRKTYIKAPLGHGDPPSNPYATGRSTESINQSNRSIPVWCVLLDNQSTVDLFCNSSLLTKISQARQTLHISCNAGIVPISMFGFLKVYGTVWFHPEGIINILSL